MTWALWNTGLKDLSVLHCAGEQMATLFTVFIQLIGTYTLIFTYN